MPIFLQRIDIKQNDDFFQTTLEYKLPLPGGQVTGDVIIQSETKPAINADNLKAQILKELLEDLKGGEELTNITIDKYRSRDALHGDNTEFEFRANYQNAHFSGTVNIPQDKVDQCNFAQLPNLIAKFLLEMVSSEEGVAEVAPVITDSTKE